MCNEKSATPQVTHTAPRIDLSKLQRYRMASGPIRGRNLYKDDTGVWVKIQDVERALNDASPTPVAAAPVGDDGRPMVLVSQEFKAQAEYDAKISSDASNLLRDNALGLTGSLPAMVGELLNLASTPAAPGVDLATAWAEGYRSGVTDERISESNIGIAGFGAKIEPARANPYMIDASPKGVTLHNDGSSEAQFIADTERLNCPACGGSGHVDDSPKGGSDAYAAALVQAMRDARAGVFDQERHVIATLNWLENRASKIVSVQATSAEVGVTE